MVTFRCGQFQIIKSWNNMKYISSCSELASTIYIYTHHLLSFGRISAALLRIGVPVDVIYGRPIFGWIAVTWLKDHSPWRSIWCVFDVCVFTSSGRFSIKMLPYQYSHPHVKDKTVSRLIFDGIPYLERRSLYCDRALFYLYRIYIGVFCLYPCVVALSCFNDRIKRSTRYFWIVLIKQTAEGTDNFTRDAFNMSTKRTTFYTWQF